MSIDKRVTSPAEAVAGLVNGACIMISGFGGAGVPVNLVRAVEACGVRDLTLVVNTLRFIDTYAT